MPNEQALEMIRSGVDAWNSWRKDTLGRAQANLALRWHFKPSSPSAFPDLTNANLAGRDLFGCDLSNCDLGRANLAGANLRLADLTRAKLQGADMSGAILDMADLRLAQLMGANLVGANLHGAFLQGADLSAANLATATLVEANFQAAVMRKSSLYATNLIQANLQSADLRDSDLQSAIMVDTIIGNARLTGCSVYGLSAWRLKGVPAEQSDLVITPHDESRVTVGDLAVAQFIYLLLDRRNLRNVITTLGETAVLILGRFTERKGLLDGIAGKFRSLGYLPIIFDFERPAHRDLTETVKVLAGLSRFVIADITGPRSAPLELQATVPDYMTPFVTILQRGEPAFAMFDDLPGKYHWALPLLEYNTEETLLATFEQKVVAPALLKLEEVRRRKAQPAQRRSAED